MNTARIGILTVSDRAFAGIYEDRSGKAILAYLQGVLTCDFEHDYRVIPDERDRIQDAMRSMEEDGASLILTTGGTGPALRDVTPEATEAVADKLMPGFGEQMRVASLAQVPTAILSRQTAAILGKALIINLPGKPRAIDCCLDAVFAAVPYCIDLIGGAYLTTNEDRIVAFRPKKKKKK